MMNKIINKLFLGVFMISFALLSAQQTTPMPPELSQQTGDFGTIEEVSIDMYEGALLVIGLAFIFYFVSRYYRKRVA